MAQSNVDSFFYFAYKKQIANIMSYYQVAYAIGIGYLIL